MRPVRLIALTSTFVFLSIAPPLVAHAADLSAGDTCVLKTSIKITADARGKGAKRRLKAGSKVTVVEVSDAAVRVRLGKAVGFIKRDVLEQWCRSKAGAAETAGKGDAGRAKDATAGGDGAGGAGQKPATPAAANAAAGSRGTTSGTDGADAQATSATPGSAGPLAGSDASTGATTGSPAVTPAASLTDSTGAGASSPFGDGGSTAADSAAAGSGVLAEGPGTVVVAVNEDGATIKIDDAVVGVSPAPPFTVPGGPHTIMVEKTGFNPFKRDVSPNASAETRVDARLLPSEEFVHEYQTRTSSRRVAAWTSLGIGVLGLAGGGTLYALARRESTLLNRETKAYNAAATRTAELADRLEQHRKRKAVFEAISIAAGGVGVVAVGTGVWLRIWGEDPDRYGPPVAEPASAPLVRVSPAAGGGAVVSLGGSF